MYGTHFLFLLVACLPFFVTADTCNRPKKMDTSFNAGYIYGPWYVVRGLNPDRDCFNCYNITFLAMHNNTFYAVEHYEKLIDPRSYAEHDWTVLQWNVSTPGILQFDSASGGDTLEWRILDYGDDYVYSYYCGTNNGKDPFHGSVVYSKTETLSKKVISKLENVASSVGLKFDAYCEPANSNC